MRFNPIIIRLAELRAEQNGAPTARTRELPPERLDDTGDDLDDEDDDTED